MTDTFRSWDAIVADLETITAEARAKVNAEAPTPPDPEPEPEPEPGDVIYVREDLPGAIANAPAGATLDLCGLTFATIVRIDKPLTVQNGEIAPTAANINEIVELRGEGIRLVRINVRGNGSAKRGISNQAKGTVLDTVRVFNICREGQESQAMAMWDTTGPLLATDCYFEGGSIPFLSGGASPTVPNTIPTGLTFKRCIFTRPLAWRQKNYACKNSFELKCARDVVLEDCEISNVWPQGQSGFAIQLTPSQYGNSPETIVDNVRFIRCNIHDTASGINMLGYSQHQAERPTQRGGNYHFIDCTFTLSRATYGGHGTLVQIGWEPANVEFLNNTVVQDGDAFMRVADRKPVAGFTYQGGSLAVPGTYGVFSPIGNRGAGWAEIAPGGVIEGVTFTNAHAMFKSNFPKNTYVTTATQARDTAEPKAAATFKAPLERDESIT